MNTNLTDDQPIACAPNALTPEQQEYWVKEIVSKLNLLQKWRSSDFSRSVTAKTTAEAVTTRAFFELCKRSTI